MIINFLIIIQGNMGNKEPKPTKQHFLPRVYLKQWEDSKGKIWVYDLQKKVFSDVTEKSFFYIKDMYSLTVNEIFALGKQEKLDIISPLDEYDIFLDDILLSGIQIIENIEKINEFIIMKDGKKIKDALRKDLIKKVKYRKVYSIEKNYSSIENGWNDVVDFFQNYRNEYMLNHNYVVSDEEGKNFGDALKIFILSMVTRNPYFISDRFVSVQKNKNIKLMDNIKRSIFEKIQMDFKDNTRYLFDIKEYSIILGFANNNHHFYTCDLPVMFNQVGEKFEGIWFPMTPDIIVGLGYNNNDDKINILEPCILENEKINEINCIICEKAKRYIVTNKRIDMEKYSYCQNERFVFET